MHSNQKNTRSKPLWVLRRVFLGTFRGGGKSKMILLDETDEMFWNGFHKRYEKTPSSFSRPKKQVAENREGQNSHSWYNLKYIQVRRKDTLNDWKNEIVSATSACLYPTWLHPSHQLFWHDEPAHLPTLLWLGGSHPTSHTWISKRTVRADPRVATLKNSGAPDLMESFATSVQKTATTCLGSLSLDSTTSLWMLWGAGEIFWWTDEKSRDLGNFSCHENEKMRACCWETTMFQASAGSEFSLQLTGPLRQTTWG